MYSQFFDAVQFSDLHVADKAKGEYVGKIYGEDSTFEEYCTDAIERLKEQRQIMRGKLTQNTIDQIYCNMHIFL